MKKLHRIMAMLLGVLICFGMMSVCAFAQTDLDYDDGYVIAYDTNNELFGSVYEVGHTFEYRVRLMIWDNKAQDYTAVAVEETDTLELYDALAIEETLIASSTGNSISWTAADTGYHEVELRLTRGDSVYYGYEVYQIGEPWDIANADIEYDGFTLTQGERILYNNTSIKDHLKVYFYPAGEYLREGADYTLKVNNAKGPGKATITVTGKGKCVGTVQIDVDIFSPSAKFKDVKQKGWYAGAINYAIVAGLFNGTSSTTFEPDGTMTRGMFVTVVGRFLGLDPKAQAPAHGFADVPAEQYYAPYVAWCSALGIVEGMDATHFAPNENITREQLCTMISRLNSVMRYVIESMPEVDEDFPLTMKKSQSKFADDSKISSWARDAVYRCRGEEIVNGKPGNIFDPRGKATRAEVATIMLNYTNFVNGLLTNFFD